MMRAFIVRLDTYEEMDRAIGLLFDWRAANGLETNPSECTDNGEVSPESYEMCSSTTIRLAKIYQNYITLNQCDDRDYNYYPLLDNILEWLDIALLEQ